MSEAEGVGFAPLEERLPGDLAAWEAAALQFAVGVHGALIRENVTAREAFSALCENLYCGACECKDGVPAGAEYVVCMSEEEADRCVPMAGPGVTLLLGFQLHGDPSGPLCSVERLAFSFTADEIIEGFAYSFERLASIDFSGVRGITVICDGFLWACSSLRSFDFAPFKSVHTTGAYCLLGCDALSDVKLRGLENLRSVGRGFLSWGANLESLDLRPLRSLENIGPEFLAYTRLTALDLEPLHAVKHIPSMFLSSTRLGSLDFSPLTSVESIESGFVKVCANLCCVDLRGLEKVRTIGGNAFQECRKLQHVDFSHLRNVRQINLDGFLRGCGALSDESRASAEAFKKEYLSRPSRSRGR